MQELQAVIDAFDARMPHVIEYQEAENGRAELVLIRKELPPDAIGPIIGDIVHNCRAALDILACELVRTNGGSTSKLSFPVGRNESELEKAIKDSKFERATPEALAILKSLKPYKGGNDWLRAIRDFDVIDKHRNIVPVVGSIYIRDVQIEAMDIATRSGAIKIAPFQMRFVIFSHPIGWSFSLGAPITPEYDLIFPGETPFDQGQLVLPSLCSMIEAAEATVQAFRPCLSSEAGEPVT